MFHSTNINRRAAWCLKSEMPVDMWLSFVILGVECLGHELPEDAGIFQSTLPWNMHWPLHLRDEIYFRKCGFYDHWEAWEWKAESSNGKSIFVMPNCGCVLVGSTIVEKKEGRCLKAIARSSWRKDSESLIHGMHLFFIEYPGLRWPRPTPDTKTIIFMGKLWF